MTGSNGWTIERHSAPDGEDLLPLLREVAGEGEAADPAYQEWQQQQSPAGPPVSVVAREAGTGRLIGLATALPISVRISGSVYTAGLSLNPVVSAGYQGRALSADLLDAVCAQSEKDGISFTYGFPSQALLPAFVGKGGFKDVGAVPFLVRPLRPESLAMKTTGSRVLGRTASLARIVWRTPSVLQQEQLPGLEIDEVDSFDEPFAIFWHRVQHRFPIMVVRDPAYLNWRFKGPPTREYKVLAARSEGKIRAYIALRVAALGRLSAGLIVDLLVETSGEGRAAGRLLIDKATAFFREQDLDLVAGLALRHTDEFRLLRARGFWVSPRFLEPQSFRMVVRAHEEEASPSHLAYRLRNWFLALGDYETF